MNPNTLTGGPAATMAALRAALHAATATNTNGNQDDLITALRAIVVDAESGDNGSTSAPATAGGDLAEQPGGILSNIAGDSPADMDEQVDSTNLDTTATDTDLDPAVAGGLAAPSDERRLRMVAKANRAYACALVEVIGAFI